MRFQGLRFINSTQRTMWTPPFNQIFLDLDGSLTGHVDGTAIPYTPFNNFGVAASGCVHVGVQYDSGIVCDGSETVRRVSIDGVNPREMDFKFLGVSTAAGTGLVQFQPKESYGWVFPAIMKRLYRLSFRSAVEFQVRVCMIELAIAI